MILLDTLEHVLAHTVVFALNDIVPPFLQLLLLHRGERCINKHYVDTFVLLDKQAVVIQLAFSEIGGSAKFATLRDAATCEGVRAPFFIFIVVIFKVQHEPALEVNALQVIGGVHEVSIVDPFGLDLPLNRTMAKLCGSEPASGSGFQLLLFAFTLSVFFSRLDYFGGSLHNLPIERPDKTKRF